MFYLKSHPHRPPPSFNYRVPLKRRVVWGSTDSLSLSYSLYWVALCITLSSLLLSLSLSLPSSLSLSPAVGESSFVAVGAYWEEKEGRGVGVVEEEVAAAALIVVPTVERNPCMCIQSVLNLPRGLMLVSTSARSLSFIYRVIVGYVTFVLPFLQKRKTNVCLCVNQKKDRTQ